MRNHYASSRALLIVVTAALVAGACREVSGPPSTERPDPHATLLTAASPTLLGAIVGSEIVDLPTVITHDSQGNPVAGITVTYQLVGGQGHVGGATVISNSSGIARLGSWRVSIRPGANRVQASTAGSVVSFTAIGEAGPPATMTKIAGFHEVVGPEGLSGALPRVLLSDKYGNPVAGAPVTFAIATGNGTIAGATSATLSDGTAAPASLEVSGLGRHQIVASTPSAPDVTFSVLVIESSDPSCGELRRLSADQAIQADLGLQGCRTHTGRRFDTYEIQSTTGVSVSLTSAAFDTYLELFSSNGTPVARNDDASGGSNSAIRAFLPPGRYVAAASSAVGGSGAYEIRTVEAGSYYDGCELIFVVPGIEIMGALNGTRCGSSTANHLYRIYLRQGSVITVTLRDMSYSDWTLDIADPRGHTVAVGVPGRPYEHVTTLVAGPSAYYTIRVSSGDGSEYALSIR